MIKKFGKKIIKWLTTARALQSGRMFFGKIVRGVIASKNGVIIFYNDPARAKVLALIRQIKNENETLLCDNEAYQIFMAVKSTRKIKGDIAEVGVYKGGSAKIICEAKGDKTLHLFDTFAGLPNLSDVDNPRQFHKGKYAASFEGVTDYLKNYPNVFLYKGIFPATAEPIKNNFFSFVNLDVDIYESTLNSLEFFYPRMNKGGVIISHDYINAPGVRKAFDDFFADKIEPVLELSGSQCLVVKL